MANLITHQDYCRAKNEAGNRHLDKVLPPETRLLFPFKYHTNFHLSVARSGAGGSVKRKRILPLLCGVCGEDLSLSGNGSYYCANIVFISRDQFYASCYDCARSIELDYHQQTYGNPVPLFLPEQFNDSVPHLLVWACHLRAWRYKCGDRTPINMTTYKSWTANSDGGFSNAVNNKGWGRYHNGTILLQDNSFKTVLKLSPGESLKLINEIITANKTLPVVKELPAVGTQLTLF